MRKHEQVLLSEKANKATIRHEVHDDHVIIIIDGGQENQFRCRLDISENFTSVESLIDALDKWGDELTADLYGVRPEPES